jgi:hypothetical protein
VFNATLSNISAILWQPVLVVEEAGVPYLGQYEKHHGMIPLLINQSNIFQDFSL